MHVVVETPGFITAAIEAGLTKDEVEKFVSMIAANPDMGDVIKGTGGARKVRVAGRGKGKSGGYRVITFFAADDVPVFLLDCYGKGDKANLTRTERNDLRQVLGRIVGAYRRGVAASDAERK